MFTAWRTSSYTTGSENSTCVEVGLAPGRVAVRDTKSRTRGHLAVSRATWRAFVTGVRTSR